MRTRKLPSRFTDPTKASVWGEEVAKGEARLDWSQVTEIGTEAIEALFRSAHPNEHEAGLGLADLPAELADRYADSMVEAMERARTATPRRKASLEAQTWESSFPPEDPVADAVARAREAQARTAAPPPKPVDRIPRGRDENQLRDEILRLVARDLVGPEGDTAETVTDTLLLGRYLLGRLAPRAEAPDLDALEDTAAEGEEDGDEGSGDRSAPTSRGYRPSSLGMTLCVAGGTGSLVVRVSFATYQKVRSGSPDQDPGKPTGPSVWERAWHEAPPLTVPLAAGEIGPLAPHPRFPEVRVRGLARTLGEEWIISLFLVNEQVVESEPAGGQREEDAGKEPSKRDAEAERWLHQVSFEVVGPGKAPVLRRRSRPGRRSEEDREERHAALRYRHHGEFAVGHGIAVEVLDPSPDQRQAHGARIAAFPRIGVRLQRSPDPEDTEGATGLETDMERLSALHRGDFGTALSPLARAYRIWIRERQARLEAGEDGLGEHRRAAQEALDDCREALTRIEAGIALLDQDPLAAECFRFANEAMRRQRQQSEVVRRKVADEPPLAAPVTARWRLFQLGFLLMNLPSLARLDHEDRALSGLADLLWFPTGGGKTEAYLGVAAFAMAMRRLRGPVEGRPGDQGVAVLMRYTLRLLTIQQFQRAATLICACEEIRKERMRSGDTRLGTTSFSIGLWVGKRTTPNTVEQSFDAVSVAKGAHRTTRSGSPVQLAHCPWCGHRIDARSTAVEVEKASRRTRISCGDAAGACPFSHMRNAPDGSREGLPIVTVDEEIYRRLPTLLLATVDKLAQLPWQGGAGQLFGRVEKRCPRHGFFGPSVEDKDAHKAKGRLPAVRSEGSPPLQPPDLVIQDELHLISGPLGSMVGLYEAAVDELCSWSVAGREVRPKIIASTATICRAEEQGRALFAREVRVFPPPGVDADDSFFAHAPVGSPERTYVGIAAPGVRKVTVLLRVYAAFMAATQKVAEDHGGDETVNPADPWMTLVGYFNSLRDLGGMRRVVEDRLSSLLWHMGERGLTKRARPKVEELTSRLDSLRIPEVLAGLERPVPALRPKATGKGAKAPRAIDILLATNMISVGVDVNRLGLMVVAGQPRSTSEYIQATSRVGRQHPGIVCTVYDWMRPRDLSHFERFAHYHATYYRQVEATSVTPFAPGALERGLAGVLVGLVRQLDLDLNENSRAQDISADHPAVRRAQTALRRRVEEITDDARLGAELEAQIRAIMDRWIQRVRSRGSGERIGYRAEADGDTRGLLMTPGLGDDSPGLQCLTSLRDVEPDIPLLFDPRPPREDELGSADPD